MAKKLSHEDYTVGWICPLEVEQIAAQEMLDEEHEQLPKPTTDHNVYSLGSIAGHNVVIAGLPQIGNCSAASVVSQMRTTFPNLKFGLLVGIAGGVPVVTDNGMIQLGDVVVSKPVQGHSGVVHYDQGKAMAGHFKRTTALAPPPAVLLNAAQELAVRRARSRVDPIQENIKRIDTKTPGLRRYMCPGFAQDRLYKPGYIHKTAGMTCSDGGCDPDQLVKRSCDRLDDGLYIVVHRGTIAAGGLVVKDAELRDKLAKQYGILCFEMEAAGALNDFPCMVIRGISDYCDTHKSDLWQGFAAAAAAAYARQLFFHMPIDEVKRCISTSAERNIEKLVQDQHQGKNQVMLDWLTPLEFGPQQSDFLSRRQPGTGDWLLASDEFKDWIDGKNQILFCPGMPGAGKTIISSLVISEITRRASEDDSIRVAYIYCNYQRQNEQGARELLASLLKQLLRELPSLPDNVFSLSARYQSRNERPSIGEIADCLQSLALQHVRTFIIIDALDECQEGVCRSTLLSEVFKFQAAAEANLFCTSRPIPTITDHFQGQTQIEIRASEADVRRYIENKLLVDGSKILQRRDDLRERVVDELTKVTDGMFLLAQLYTDSIIDKKVPRQIIESLESLREGSKSYMQAYDEAYEDALKRIKQQGPNSITLAERVLAWLTMARRPLKTQELQHAVAIEIELQDLTEDDVPIMEDLISICVGLVTVDQESSIVRLVHYTTYDYLRQNHEKWYPCMELFLFHSCIAYLSFDIFGAAYSRHDGYLDKLLADYPFYDYASRYWASYFHPAWEAGIVRRFLSDMAKVTNSSLVSTPLIQEGRFIKRWKFFDPGSEEPCYVDPALSDYNMSQSEFIRGVKCDGTTIKYPTKALFSRIMSGLHLASYFGMKELVMLLLSDGQNVNLRCTKGRTALNWAAIGGHDDLIKALLAVDDIKADTIDEDGMNPLSFAARYGHTAMVRTLLAVRGVDVNAVTGQIRSCALYEAISDPHVCDINIVELLLEAGANPNHQTDCGWTALRKAARCNNVAIAELLLQKGADINIKDNLDKTALMWAIQRRHFEAAEFLIKSGADANSKDHAGGTPLIYAVSWNCLHIVKLLVESGADLRTRDRMFHRELWEAMSVKSQKVFDYLQVNGLIVFVDYLPNMASYGFTNHVQPYVHAGADVEARKYDGKTALICAVKHRFPDIVRILIRSGADLEAKADNGRTALIEAARNKDAAMVQLLIDSGASTELKRDVDAEAAEWLAEFLKGQVVE